MFNFYTNFCLISRAKARSIFSGFGFHFGAVALGHRRWVAPMSQRVLIGLTASWALLCLINRRCLDKNRYSLIIQEITFFEAFIPAAACHERQVAMNDATIVISAIAITVIDTIHTCGSINPYFLWVSVALILWRGVTSHWLWQN